MKDNYDFVISFINAVRERPCLYDPTLPAYNMRTSQEEAWLEISEMVNLTVHECRERWKNLRGAYTRHLKNIRRGKTGKAYYLAEYLEFLEKHTKPKDSVLNDTDNSTSEAYDPDATYFEVPPTEDAKDGDSNLINQSMNQSIIRRIRKRSRQDSDEPEINMEYFEMPQNSSAREKDLEDPDYAFLYSLLPDIRAMNSAQKRKFRIGVLKMADDILT